MARQFDDGFGRRDAEWEARGRRGRRGPGPWQNEERGGGRPSRGHHRHGGGDFRGGRPEGRLGSWGRGPWGGGPEGGDELTQAAWRLLGALRALGRSHEAGQRKAIAIMDDTTRTIYRLLAEEPQPADAPAPVAKSDSTDDLTA